MYCSLDDPFIGTIASLAAAVASCWSSPDLSSIGLSSHCLASLGSSSIGSASSEGAGTVLTSPVGTGTGKASPVGADMLGRLGILFEQSLHICWFGLS